MPNRRTPSTDSPARGGRVPADSPADAVAKATRGSELAAAFRLGSGRRRHSTVAGPALLAVSLIGCLILAAAMIGGGPWGARLAEIPVPAGEWAVGWRDAVPPSVRQSLELQSLRRVAAGVAGMLGLLCLSTTVGLWRQRLRLQQREDHIHWSVGARRDQLAARLAGEGWPWGLAALVLALAAAVTVPLLITRTFPGEASVPPGLAAALITGTGLVVLLLRWESRAGERAARPGRAPLHHLAAAPAFPAAMGFAVLTGVGLLSTHAPSRDGAALTAGYLLAGVSLTGVPEERRAAEVAAWIGRAARAGHRLALASAGTTRGAGLATSIVAHCGRCSIGGLPLSHRSAQVEVFAVTEDTFPQLGLQLLEGRDFSNGRDRGPPTVAIVSRALARTHFEGGDAVGRQIRLGDSGWATVVGVVDDRPEVRDRSEYAVYLPLTQAAPTEVEVVGAAAPDVVGAMVALAPEGAESGPVQMTADVFAVHGWFAELMSLLGAVALGLVVIGVWIGGWLEARTLEFEVALRKAVGARRRDLTLHFCNTTLKTLAMALAVGAWLALAMGAGLHSAYGGIPAVDPTVSLKAALPVAAAFILGSWPPFARALRTRPAPGLDSAP